MQLLEPTSLLKPPWGNSCRRKVKVCTMSPTPSSPIESALAHLRREGARLIDEEPRIGGRGARIAFVHPADLAGTLIEWSSYPHDT